jgi:hypothetical protein
LPLISNSPLLWLTNSRLSITLQSHTCPWVSGTRLKGACDSGIPGRKAPDGTEIQISVVCGSRVNGPEFFSFDNRVSWVGRQGNKIDSFVERKPDVVIRVREKPGRCCSAIRFLY